MSFFFYDEPIKESERSILNNSVVDDDSDSNLENDFYGHPLVAGYPYIYAYPPYNYPQNPQNPQNVPKSEPKPKINKPATKRQSTHPFDKDVYKLVDFRPNVDLGEDEKNFYIQVDLPGMTKDQIHMELSEDCILKISGKRENKYKKADNKDMKVSKMDCQYGKFSRAFRIHETANLDKIQAKMENGVLSVVIPKLEPTKTQRRTIHVQ
ncbi:HSP20-like chaperone [Anaeromyces robustus]|uniref:HSP20-like chaperone n=1 Tax=Anaeromyces robustus TaxID=1754192 RepID=A0A1Y1X1Z7_9FUNG|nr:HSP20-like chaperone [Anaeromyces robustus]ORX79794.1 HSP20-like chaperone [Anaeromyces robustus]|eukprot:ORX79793.1 HSP20-like chaperone [Anaeromyces robustus]